MRITVPDTIFIENINQGGLSDSRFSGQKDSVAKLIGWDLHSEPGALQPAFKMVRDSATTVTEFCKNVVNIGSNFSVNYRLLQDGDFRLLQDGGKRVVSSNVQGIYWFSSESGKIWRGNPSTGEYVLAYTVSADEGSSAILGVAQYEGYLYIATEKRLHRIAVTRLDDWASNFEANWDALNLEQEEFGNTSQEYTLSTSVSEGATHKLSVYPSAGVWEGVALNVKAVGTGNWKATLHDSANNVVVEETIAVGDMATGWVLFRFDDVRVRVGEEYHLHVTSSVSDGTVYTGIASDFTAGNVRIFGKSDAEFHPMLEQNGVLYIGDGQYIHQVDASTGTHVFSVQALNLPVPYRVKCLAKYGTDIVIGTIVDNSTAKASVFQWTTYGFSFSVQDEVDEVGVNAFVQADNLLLAQVGINGAIYYWADGRLQLYRKIPGDYTNANAWLHPNGWGFFRNNSLLGFSNLRNNPAEQGVYTLGQHLPAYPLTLDLTYPISSRTDNGDFVLDGVDIGAILTTADSIYMSVKRGTDTFVDKLSVTERLDGAYLDTRVHKIYRPAEFNVSSFLANYIELAAGSDIEIWFRSNYNQPWVKANAVHDEIHGNFRAEYEGESCYAVEVRIVVNGSDFIVKLESGALLLR